MRKRERERGERGRRRGTRRGRWRGTVRGGRGRSARGESKR